MAASTIGECSISTIEDVARLAGVSRGSVSNVLTGKVRMRDATRETSGVDMEVPSAQPCWRSGIAEYT